MPEARRPMIEYYNLKCMFVCVWYLKFLLSAHEHNMFNNYFIYDVKKFERNNEIMNWICRIVSEILKVTAIKNIIIYPIRCQQNHRSKYIEYQLWMVFSHENHRMRRVQRFFFFNFFNVFFFLDNFLFRTRAASILHSTRNNQRNRWMIVIMFT